MLNEWILAWIAHQLPRDPLNLFNANIFHPEPLTLAYSEHMFVQSLMGAPFIWMGVPTLVVHNLLIVAGLALTGWTMCLVVTRWTGDRWAGVVAGLLLAFNSYTMTSLAHLQALHVEFLPLALYALDRLLTQPRAGLAIALALAVAAQALTSNYVLAALAVTLPVAVAARPAEWRHPRVAGYLLLSGALATLIVLPFLLPYAELRRELGLLRRLDVVELYSATWRAYVTPPSRLYFDLWGYRFWPVRAALFPGFTALALAIIAVKARHAWQDRALRLWTVMGLTGFLLSFGVFLPGYSLLHQAIPLLQGIRAPARFGYFFLAAVACLAGFGVAWLCRPERVPNARRRLWLRLAVIALVTVEAARLPLGGTPRYEVPPVYRVLASADPGAVVELPLPHPYAFHDNAPYLLNATMHWRPLVNGYSGFLPSSYNARREDLASFPSPESIAVLRRLDVRYAVIQRQAFAERGPGILARLDTTPGLRLLIADGDVAIYSVLREDR
jgi:hypothetical protein